jgi:hypothetical protein
VGATLLTVTSVKPVVLPPLASVTRTFTRLVPSLGKVQSAVLGDCGAIS